MKKIILSAAVASAIAAQYTFASSQLEEVIVTASRFNTPLREVAVSVTLIDQEEIEIRAYPSAVELLRTQAGISAANSGGSGKVTSLSVRGEEGYRTKVYLDGIELSDPSATQIGPQAQHLSLNNEIERIEILRGPQGFAYGADAGGVIQFFSLSPTKGSEAAVSLNGGSYNTKSLNGHYAWGSDNVNLLLSAGQQSTDGFNSRSVDESEETDGYENTTLHGKFAISITDKLKAEVVLRDVSAESEYDGCSYPTTHDCLSVFDQQAARLALSYGAHSIAINNHSIENDNLANGVSGFDSRGETRSAEYLGAVDFSSQVSLGFGAELRNDEMQASGDEERSRDQLGVFTELQTAFDEQLYVTVGGRYDESNDFGSHMSARVSAAWLQTVANKSSLKYRASYGNGFRAPSLYEIAYNAGDYAWGAAAETDLHEETSAGYDLGVEYYHGDSLSLKLGYFKQTIADEIYFDLLDYTGYLQASEKSHSSGIELEANYSRQVFNVFANLSVNDTETLDEQPRLRKPGVVSNLGGQIQVLENKLKLLANLRIARDMEDEVFGSGRVELEDYEVLDVSANYTLGICELQLRLTNALDADYQEVSGYNTAERAVYGGVKLSF